MQTKPTALPFVIPTGVEGSRLQHTLREMNYHWLSVVHPGEAKNLRFAPVVSF